MMFAAPALASLGRGEATRDFVSSKDQPFSLLHSLCNPPALILRASFARVNAGRTRCERNLRASAGDSGVRGVGVPAKLGPIKPVRGFAARAVM